MFLQVVYRSPVTSETLPDYNVESAENSDHVTQGRMGILGTTDRGGGTTPHTTTPGSALDTDLPWYKGRASKNDFFENPDFVSFVMISMESLYYKTIDIFVYFIFVRNIVEFITEKIYIPVYQQFTILIY